MEMDLNSLEVKVEDNEFDDCYEESVERNIDDDQEMKAVADEKENNESAEDSTNLEGASKRNHEDLRSKITKSKESNKGRENDRRRDAKDRHSCRRRPGSNSRWKQRYEGTERHGKLYQTLDASPDLDPKILGREIAYRLGETKVSLIVNVVRVLGFKCAMQILDDTRKIEKRGGMLTLDGDRRREPGGVYICCLKERGYATKKELDKIFKYDREKMKERAKRKRRKQTAKKRREMESLAKLKKQVKDYVKNKMDTEEGKENNQLSEGDGQSEDRKDDIQLSEGELNPMSD